MSLGKCSRFSLDKLGKILKPQYNLCRSVHIDHKSMPEHRSLVIEQYGEPKDVLTLKVSEPEEVLPKKLEGKQILVEHLAACVNPADINLIQGVYGIKPDLPAIPGNEGITRVKQIGHEVSHLKPGDLALGIFNSSHWQSYSVQESDSFYKVGDGLEISVAAQLKVNPCTAYRMIKDFCKLKKGDTIIQNGANSAVGVYVIQLAKLWNFKTINIIRDRTNKEEIVNELKNFGADVVLTEAEVSDIMVTKPIISEMGKPKLFLNCVGGKNAVNCQKTLDNGGYSVTYGAMSKQPFALTATSLIFKDHKYVGFWVSRWFKQQAKDGKRHEIAAMLDEVTDLFRQGTLKSKSTTLIDFEDRDIALSGSNNTKYIFSIDKS